jgi:hypothetical protein
MKHSSYLFVLLLLSTVALSGYEMIVDIFPAGIWTVMLLVILVIGGLVLGLPPGARPEGRF